LKKYILPIALGFVGMLVAHLIILLGFGAGLKIPIYFIAYPVVYTLLSFLLTKNNSAWWLSNVICLLLLPFIYWYWLLWDIGKLNLKSTFVFTDAGGMLVIVPITFLLAAVIANVLHKFSKDNHYKG
jgi:hypothetical protein